MNNPYWREGDPKTRDELKDWLKRREELFPGAPLNARQYLMVQWLRGKKPAYSLT